MFRVMTIKMTITESLFYGPQSVIGVLIIITLNTITTIKTIPISLVTICLVTYNHIKTNA